MRRPAADRRRARRTVAALVAVWLASQLCLAVAADASTWLRDPLFGDKHAKLSQRIAARTNGGGKPLSVVCVGSSRTCYAIRGDALERTLERSADRPVAAFNFGIPAAGPVTNLITVRRLLVDGDRPDLLVLEVMPPLFAMTPAGVVSFEYIILAFCVVVGVVAVFDSTTSGPLNTAIGTVLAVFNSATAAP